MRFSAQCFKRLGQVGVIVAIIAAASTGVAQDAEEKVIESDDPIRVVGEIQEPGVQYFLENREVQFEDSSEERSFIPNVLDIEDEEALQD